MTSVLLVHDEYGTSRGGISTINRQVALFLVHLGLKVYCTVLTATDKDREDAKKENVILLFPQCDKHDRREPSLYDHRSRYPDLPSDIGFVIGHVLVTSRAAVRIKEERFPLAKLYLFTHVLPENTEHYKGEGKALGIEEKMQMILEDAEKADALFSVGPAIYDYYQNQYRCLQDPSKPHYQFLPKPSDIFIEIRLTYVETKTKTVLSFGRVSGVEILKGYDLGAAAMSDVAKRLPKAKWQARGISKDDFQTSKEIIEANIHSGTFHFTPLEYGTQDQICRDMKQAHLVLIPSRSEPFGLVGLEAIAAGVPVLVTDQSGLAEFMLDIAPEFDHCVFKLSGNNEEDSKNLANKIVAMLQNSSSEFKLAKHLKDKLLGSRYWEESQKKLAQVCGKVYWKPADTTPEAATEMETGKIAVDVPQHAVEKAWGSGRDQASSSYTPEEENDPACKRRRLDTTQTTGTEEQRNALRSAISTLYKNTLNTLKPLPWDDRFTLDLDKIFTSLSLHGHGDRGMLESLDDVFDHQTKTDLAERLNVLVVGDAGSGKSTLLSKTSLDWSCEKGRLSEMNKIVLLIRLREVQAGESIAGIIWDQCVTQSEDISVASIETCLRENEPRLVFLLDGYDELVPSASQPKETIPKLLGHKLYPRSIVIVTSRPFSGVEQYMKVNCEVRVVGYSSGNIQKYATTYFETVCKPNLAVSLVQALQANIVARNLIQTPMFLMLICVLWEEDSTRVFPGTMSGLFQELLTCVVRKYCVRDGLAMPNDEFPSEVSTALLHLGKLALESLLRGESLVDLANAPAIGDTDILLKLGIVSKEVSASRLHPREQLNFPHKTMQEFLAGRYVVNTSSVYMHTLFPQDTVKALLKQGNLVQFICSCSSKATKEMLANFNRLHKSEVEHVSEKFEKVQGKEFYTPQMQNTSLHEAHKCLKKLCIMSLYEGQDPKHFPIVSTLLSSLDLTINVPSKEGAALKYYLQHAPTVPCGRSLSLTLQEVSNGDAIEYLSGLVHVVKSLPDLQLYLNLSRSRLGDLFLKFLNAMLHHLPCLLNINLSQNKIGEKDLEPFAAIRQPVASLRVLDLSNNKIGDVCLKSLAGVLHHLSCLEKLNLSRNNIGNDRMEPFSVIQQPVACLNVLNLSWNKIGDVCLTSLASVLHHLSCLEWLDLSYNNIGNEGLEPFSVIQQPVASLYMLNLSDNKIGDVCLGSLSAVLRHLSCLEKLDLSWNNIGNNGLEPFSVIQQPVASLKVLDLSRNKIGDVCLKSLVAVLRHLSCLEKLDLSWNNIGNNGLEPFSVIQQPVASLKVLYLQHNKIGDVCLKSLAAVLHHLSCLTIFDLSMNNIKDTELVSLAANLHHVPSLEMVNLFKNPITAVGIKDFAQTILMMPALKALLLNPQQTAHLDDTAATSITTMLTRLPVLERLDLQNISMDAAGFQAVCTAVEEHTTMQAEGLQYSITLVPGLDYKKKWQDKAGALLVWL
ncbi:NLR family CARD domain-containing protein 3-like [Branchiostoma lanceolatum]|uniref:NLR family CARD domain-containing protein 3-like n=1 Tax=Branchiostoma lanceolatum TaxID=7740 RepID=UPI0034552C9B